MDFVLTHPYLIPLLPLIGAAVAGFFGAKYLKGQSHWPIWLGVGASAVLSLTLLFGAIGQSGHGHGEAAAAGEHAAAPATAEGEHKAHFPGNFVWFDWIQLGSDNAVGDTAGNPAKAFTVPFGFWLDPLTAVMLSVVCGIGFLITVFAAGYMKGEEGYFRFFAYLGLFIFMMTCLVMGNNLIMLYLGWEGVGLSSYLLIGYYYDKPAAREAAKKAFLVNRIGDFGFALGIMLSFAAFGTVTYFDPAGHAGQGLLQQVQWAATHRDLATPMQNMALDWVPFLLMLGAFGKSAQFPLYVWLPDAMEGPTPVSALIHAATMVTAGVYMIARCGVLFVSNEPALITIGVVGAFTALFAGSIALRQTDLKKVFAYSTVSQLGFMFVGVAVLAPVAAVFHLITHAFFKALLFLSSGVVMHAMNGVLDLREMSGLKRELPKTRIVILIGCLALAGMVPFSGFFSKDEIIHAAGHGGGARIALMLVLLVTAFLTAYYTFRLYFQVFEGPLKVPAAPAGGHGHGGHGHDAHGHTDVDDHLATKAHHDATDHGHGGGHGHGHGGHHNHEPLIMLAPLFVLAVGALLAGFLNWPGGNLGSFLGGSPSFAGAYEVAKARFGDGADAHLFGQHAEGG
ncbi:MAG TPA: NADH-quinone oxidoreductase subunit L [Humisphaera sp.]